jgi:Zn-dependent protease
MNADTPPAPPPASGQSPRPRGIKLGVIAGVPIYLQASWLVLAVVVVLLYGPLARTMLPQLSELGGYGLALLFVLALLLSVLLHELGHAVTARHYRIGVRAITLELLGGYTEMESDSPNAKADLAVSLSGPLVSLVLGLGALAAELVLPDRTILKQLAFQLAWSNLIVAVFNALPGLPLDGGRALRAGIWAATGNRHTGTRAAGWIGRFVAVGTVLASLLLVLYGVLSPVSLVFTLLVGWTLWQGATAAIQQGKLAVKLPLVDLRQLARPVYAVAPGTSLAEAQRRAAETGRPDAALAVADSSGRLIALVHDDAAAAVPPERRPWVPVESVSRAVAPEYTLAADLSGEDVIRAVQAHPASTYLVVAGTEVVGVLRTADLAQLLSS